ncbi:MAG: hypothetical protein ABSA91_01865 [Acidimicrobiales bacterium]|jgi:hypothetical protein
MPDSDDRTEPSTGAEPGVAHGAGTASGPSGPPSAPGPQVKAWADELSDYVVEGVGWLKARTTVPVMTVLRVVVYGLVVAVALLVALVLGVIGLVRMWDAYVPLSPEGRRVWLGYVVVGGLLFVAGAVLLARRRTGKG